MIGNMLKAVGGIVVLFLTLGFIGVALQSRTPAARTAPGTGITMPGPQTVITQAEYLRLTDGISYAKAVQIIGAPGQETSRSTMPAVPGIMPALETVSYSWVNPGGGNAMLMFQNDKLTTKAQFGLR